MQNAQNAINSAISEINSAMGSSRPEFYAPHLKRAVQHLAEAVRILDENQRDIASRLS